MPEQPTPDVPEVTPTEHIVPEMPPEPAPTVSEPAPVVLAPIDDGPAPAPAVREDNVPRFIEPKGKPKAAPAKQPVKQPRESRKEARPAPPKAKPQRKEHYTLITVVSAIRSLIVTFAAAVIVSTIFMWWTSPDFLSASVQKGLAPAQATAARREVTPTGLPTPIWFNRIGVVAGHSGVRNGQTDPGAVCPDGFNEAGVVMNVAQRVVATLRGRGFTVDLLEEFDDKLDGYQAAAFISLHADSCENFNDGFNHSGFKSTYPTERFSVRERDERLNTCVRENYAAITGLPFTAGSITRNMTEYHAFRKMAPSTPAIILEVGMLSYDRDMLQNHTDKLAQGVVNGLLCFLNPVSLATNAAPVVTPTPPLAPVTGTSQR